MSRAIVITSGKGGVGKTTLTVNMGRILADVLEKKTVVLDTDFGLNNIDVLTGVENKIVYDLIDVIQNRCRLSQALIKDEYSELCVLPSMHSYDESKIDAQAIRTVVNSLRKNFDYILIDCPAGIEKGFHRAVASSDEAIVVTTPHLSALRDAEKAVRLIESYRIDKINLVVNRVRGDLLKRGDMVSATDAQIALGISLLGAVPEEDSLNLLSSVSLPTKEDSEGYKATLMLCKKLHYGKGEVYDASKRYSGFWGKIRSKIRSIS